MKKINSTAKKLYKSVKNILYILNNIYSNLILILYYLLINLLKNNVDYYLLTPKKYNFIPN